MQPDQQQMRQNQQQMTLMFLQMLHLAQQS
jgi:hypothetical protein